MKIQFTIQTVLAHLDANMNDVTRCINHITSLANDATSVVTDGEIDPRNCNAWLKEIQNKALQANDGILYAVTQDIAFVQGKGFIPKQWEMRDPDKSRHIKGRKLPLKEAIALGTDYTQVSLYQAIEEPTVMERPKRKLA